MGDDVTLGAATLGAAALGIGIILWAPPVAAADPAVASDPVVDRDALVRAVAAFNQHAHYRLPDISEPELAALLSGEVVRWIDRPNGPDGHRRAAALILTSVGRDAMWLACQDPHFLGDPSVHELRLTLRPPDDADWFGLLDLPAPFDDRYWMVRSWNNHALSVATGGVAWEHPWTSIAGDLDRVRTAAEAGEIVAVTAAGVDEAILAPSNDGAFVAIALPGGGSLFGYHATFAAGGNIPDWAVTRWAYSGLERAMRNYVDRATTVMPGHYGASHAPVVGGAGQAVPPQ
jgi:hypothetical protein